MRDAQSTKPHDDAILLVATMNGPAWRMPMPIIPTEPLLLLLLLLVPLPPPLLAAAAVAASCSSWMSSPNHGSGKCIKYDPARSRRVAHAFPSPPPPASSVPHLSFGSIPSSAALAKIAFQKQKRLRLGITNIARLFLTFQRPKPALLKTPPTPLQRNPTETALSRNPFPRFS